MRTEDGEIVRKCLNGDSAAFGLLVDKYKARVNALAYSKLRDFRDAEDGAQEVFIKAYQKLRNLKQWDKVYSWLYSITSNLCKNVIRAQTARPDSEFIADHLATLEKPSEYPDRDDLMMEMLHEVLSFMPEVYQQVLTLYYMGGMSSREIATSLDMSPSAIRQRLSRARMLLKEEMMAMIASTFEEQQLQSSFTFRVVESVKRTKIQPLPGNMFLPLEFLQEEGEAVESEEPGEDCQLGSAY
jgi:RNA polymerase sigma factor (sigma-70 family)